jgi:hypothetical protein
MAIRCHNGHDNVDGAFFCDQCGVALDDGSAQMASVCALCGQPNTPGVEVCANCGATLITPAASANRQARLIVVASNVGVDLSTLDEAIIGRSDPAAEVFPEIDLAPYGGEKEGVSRQHARLRCSGDRFTVEDLRSVNYTFLNKQRLEPETPTPLKNGDELRLGRIVLRFEVE